MSFLNRAMLVKMHMLLAAFVFPVAFMFLVTGGFYTWGIKGSYIQDVHILALEAPLQADLQPLKALVEQELQNRRIALPTGEAKIKKGGTSFQLEWTGSERDVILEPTADNLSAKLTIMETTWYRQFVQLHKAKGGQFFKVYAAILAVSLFSILLSGFLMAWQIPKYRGQALIFAVAGLVFFVLMVSSS